LFLHKISISFVLPSHTVCLDEAVWGYLPKKKTKQKADESGRPIPVVFIPKKPHLHGFLVYFLVIYFQYPHTSRRFLYVIDMMVHHSTGDVSPNKAVRYFLER